MMAYTAGVFGRGDLLIGVLFLAACHQLASYAPSSGAKPQDLGASELDADSAFDLSADAPLADALSPDQGSSAPWRDGWSLRKKITIDHSRVSGSDVLQNFPLLAKLSSVSGALLFTGSDGSTELSHEIEQLSGGSLVAWVSLPMLSPSNDTVIYLYHGGTNNGAQPPGAVWAAYAGVWHLSGPQDSTANANHGEVETGDPVQSPSPMGLGYEFDGSTDVIAAPSSSSLNLTTSTITLEAWVKPDLAQLSIAPPQQEAAVPIGKNGYTEGYRFLMLRGDPIRAAMQIPTTSISGSAATITGDAPIVNGWVYFAATYDGQTMRLYVNGEEDVAVARQGSLIACPDMLVIGHGTSAGHPYSYPWPGAIDELRVSSVFRSGDWIRTQHHNYSSPASFYQVVDEQRPLSP